MAQANFHEYQDTTLTSASREVARHMRITKHKRARLDGNQGSCLPALIQILQYRSELFMLGMLGNILLGVWSDVTTTENIIEAEDYYGYL